MHIESIRIRNYRVLRAIEIRDLSPFTVFLGANGVGKSTLFDLFGFLRDSLLLNVRMAFIKRGGFKEVVSRGQRGPIEIELRMRDQDSFVTYQLLMGLRHEQPVVERECLTYQRQGGKVWSLLDFRFGIGQVITNEQEYAHSEPLRQRQELESADILALKGLGQFSQFKQAATLRQLIENWHLSDFHIADARPSQEAGHQGSEHLSERGDNLPLVAQFMYHYHAAEFKRVLEKLSQHVPGISNVAAEETVDGRIVLKFQDGAFKDPFLARYLSDGTLKMFAYLLLLHDPTPHSLLALEEPEKQLHPSLLEPLAEEFREYAHRGGQAFISTHSPDFVNGVALDELFWLEKTKEGFSRVYRARDDEMVRMLLEEGDQLGYLWKQGFLRGSGPR